jgi:hypothetical protein
MNQMGRCVKTGLQWKVCAPSKGPENRLGKRTGAPFSVGARDVDDIQSIDGWSLQVCDMISVIALKSRYRNGTY